MWSIFFLSAVLLRCKEIYFSVQLYTSEAVRFSLSCDERTWMFDGNHVGLTNLLKMLISCKVCHETVQRRLFSQTRYFCPSQFYLSEECTFKCQIKRATIRALWLFMKDNEEQRMGALFRQKGFAGTSEIIVWHFSRMLSGCLYIIPL